MTKSPANPAPASAVIVACDFADAAALRDFLAKLGDARPYLKVGMELFYSTGPDLVRELKGAGFRIFLDLKLHDIPNTVGKAMRQLATLGVDMVNLHAAGGSKMIEAAIQGLTLDDGTRPTKLLAVTQLTSTSPEMLADELLIDQPIDQVVASYAKTAQRGGADGVVCSPREASLVKERCGQEFLTVTPGIRFADSAADDQVRVATPLRAREMGADFIVVGRPITQAPDPAAAYQTCVRQFEQGIE